MRNYILFFTILLTSINVLVAQANTTERSKPEPQFELIVKVNAPIQEHDVYLLRNELESSIFVTRVKKINHREGVITFVSNNKNKTLFKPIFKQYFSRFKISSRRIKQHS